MEPGRYQTQITWAGALTKAVAFGASAESDVITPPPGAQSIAIQIRVNNDGTPGAGDTATVKVLYTLGDMLNDPEQADVYDVVASASSVLNLNTQTANPDIRTVTLTQVAQRAFKIVVTNASAADQMTFAGRVSFNVITNI